MARTRKATRDDFERLSTPGAIRDLVEQVPGFDRKGFLSAFIDCFGGVERFAQAVFVEFQAAPAGSMAKQRYSSMICTLISQESANESQRPAELLDDDELGATLRSLAAEATNVGVPDGGVPPA